MGAWTRRRDTVGLGAWGDRCNRTRQRPGPDNDHTIWSFSGPEILGPHNDVGKIVRSLSGPETPGAWGLGGGGSGQLPQQNINCFLAQPKLSGAKVHCSAIEFVPGGPRGTQGQVLVCPMGLSAKTSCVSKVYQVDSTRRALSTTRRSQNLSYVLR